MNKEELTETKKLLQERLKDQGLLGLLERTLDLLLIPLVRIRTAFPRALSSDSPQVNSMNKGLIFLFSVELKGRLWGPAGPSRDLSREKGNKAKERPALLSLPLPPIPILSVSPFFIALMHRAQIPLIPQ